MIKNLPVNAGDIQDAGSIPGHGNPLQYSCLENPIDRGAGRAMVHESHSLTGLKRLSAHTHKHTHTHTHTREEYSTELKDRMNLDLSNFTQKKKRHFFGGKKKSVRKCNGSS